MKFYNYINEMDFNNIIKVIERDCSIFLKDWKKLNTTKFLYSGRQSTIEFGKKKVKTDRRPKTTPLHIHNILDNWFHKKFGIKARSNSIFVTSSESQTYFYGYPFIIFPINKYLTISSIMVDDLTIRLGNKINWKNTTEKEIFDIMDTYSYDSKLSNMKHEIEMMLICKEYYMVTYNYEDQLLQHFKG